MKIRIPNKVILEKEDLELVGLELYNPLFIPTGKAGNSKATKPLTVIKIKVTIDQNGDTVPPEVHESIYGNFKSLRFVLRYKDGREENIEFENKEELFKEEPIQTVSILKQEEPTILPQVQIANSSVEPLEEFPVSEHTYAHDPLAEEERLLNERLSVLRSPEVLAKRKEIALLKQRLEQLHVEIQPVHEGKLVKP